MKVITRLVRPVQQPVARIVEHPLNLKLSELGLLEGVIQSQTGVPIAGAKIEAPHLNKKVTSDAWGCFRIAGAPPDKPVILDISAKGRAIEFALTAGEPANIVIVMPTEEEHA